MEADKLISMHKARDAEWVARHAELDTSLAAAIQPRVVDERFDEQVWAKVRADEAHMSAMLESLRGKLGVPWWLDCLNMIAVVATMGAVALAFGPAIVTALAEQAAVEPSSDAVRIVAMMAGATVLWFGVRNAVLAFEANVRSSTLRRSVGRDGCR
jgi:hypothetical protein